MRLAFFFGLLLVAGCASTKNGEYRPAKSREKEAFAVADRTVSPNDVRAGFRGLEATEVAWAGIITDVQFEEKERKYQVAFEVEHRPFDWQNHGGSQPFHLGSKGEGAFVAGWYANKPTSIWRLRQLADVGDMIIVYGKPYRMRDGVIQLAATAIRPIKAEDFEVAEGLAGATAATNSIPTEATREKALELLGSMDAPANEEGGDGNQPVPGE